MPPATASAIAGMCNAQLYDIPALVHASRKAGSLAIPLVKELTRTVALYDEEAARKVHWGSTSQNVVDTAMALVTREALQLLDDGLRDLTGHLLDLARRYLAAPVLARTLMQPAQVTSFGYKACGWLAPLVRARMRLREAAARALRLQLGGAIGTLSAHGALRALNDAMAGLAVDSGRMLANIDALHGLVFSEAAAAHLAGAIGRPRAHQLLEQLTRRVVGEGRHLKDLLLEAVQADAGLRAQADPAALAALFDPVAATAPAQRLANRQLAALAETMAALDRLHPLHRQETP